LPDTNVTIAEGTYTSQTVWVINSTDVDNDADPSFAIISQEVNGTFSLNGDNTELITSATFDFENKTTYEVTLQYVLNVFIVCFIIQTKRYIIYPIRDNRSTLV
jgi:hypothetical protein